MLQIWLVHAFKAVDLNKFHDTLKAGSNIKRKSVKSGLGFLVKKSDSPLHERIISFLQCLRKTTDGSGWVAPCNTGHSRLP